MEKGDRGKRLTGKQKHRKKSKDKATNGEKEGK
jgi:hypothetical protein